VLAQLLAEHPEVVLGQERFSTLFLRGRITPDLLERGRYFDMRPGDTHDAAVKLAASCKKTFEERWSSALWVGDKYPDIYRVYEEIFEVFPNAKVIYILRNPLSVAESYQARFENKADRFSMDYRKAIKDWNESVAETERQLKAGRDITLVTYEMLLFSIKSMKALMDQIGLKPLADETYQDYAVEARRRDRKPASRSEKIRRFASMHADFGAYRRLIRQHCILSRAAVVGTELAAQPQPAAAQAGR
jgi:hypothetical protein